MSTEFKWDDENVKEFVTDLLRNGFYNIPKHLDDFKASKQPKQDWEIVAYIFKANDIIINKGEINFDFAAKANEGYEIYSVKRLSDGEVFSLGDKVVYMNNHSIYDTIEKIQLGDSQFGPKSSPAPYFVVENSSFGCYIDKINHYIPQILFTTEDSIPTYDGDSVWKVCILKDSWSLDETKARKELLPIPSYFKYFSTKEKAEEYVLYNKPILSLQDIRDVGPITPDNIYFLALIKKAKDKLNIS